MSGRSDIHAQLSVEQRKQMLVVEGALYRSEIAAARQAVRGSLRAESLARSAIGHLTATASAAVDNIFSLKALKEGGLQSLAPLLATGFSLLSRKGMIRPALRVAVVVAGVAALAYTVVKRKRTKQQAES